ncbi:hypothetical protein ACFW4G_28055 [Paenibacillus lactis]|uniref:hypothetical protein n=1 Tax=Paenibacillus TaxID=44249 RepID=UPI001643509B|nr:hypothetical protein [Paenibacillus sp. IHBB 10380]
MITNAVIIGYALLAAKKSGLSKQELKELEAIMRSVLDEYTEEEAEAFYRAN